MPLPQHFGLTANETSMLPAFLVRICGRLFIPVVENKLKCLVPIGYSVSSAVPGVGRFSVK